MSPCYNPAGSLARNSIGNHRRLVPRFHADKVLAARCGRQGAAGKAHRVTMCLGSQVAMPGNT